MFRKQLAMVKTLRQNPNLGTHVHNLRWSTVSLTDEIRTREYEPAMQMEEEGKITEDDLKRLEEEIDGGGRGGMVNEPLDDGVNDAICVAVGEHVELAVAPDATRCFWRADDSYGHGSPLVEDEDGEYDI